ncbi:MAG: hypothetical protein PVG32_12640 [Anaerolineales bacterium]
MKCGGFILLCAVQRSAARQIPSKQRVAALSAGTLKRQPIY